MMANLPHFIQYQGSKRNLAKYILQFFPKKLNRPVEPFAGTAVMSVATSASQITQNLARRPQPDRADRQLSAAGGQAGQERDTQGLQGCVARDVHDAQRSG